MATNYHKGGEMKKLKCGRTPSAGFGLTRPKVILEVRYPNWAVEAASELVSMYGVPAEQRDSVTRLILWHYNNRRQKQQETKMETPSLTLHICAGKTGEICAECGKKIGCCPIHDIPREPGTHNSSSHNNGIVFHDCPKCGIEQPLHYQKTDKVGFGVTDPTADMECIGTVVKIEEATYSYGDLHDENYNSILAIPLLKFVGKRVRVRVDVLEDKGEK